MSVEKQKHSFNGVFLAHKKNTKDQKAVNMPLPQKVYIPMSQHMGRPCEPLVKKGDTVLVGQKIGDTESFMAAPIHSSVSGTVTAIEEITTAGGVCKSVVIETDGEQKVSQEVKPPVANNLEEFIECIRQSGLVGLGGAGFPTHVKFATDELDGIDTLVINAAECEPYITSDNRTMIDYTSNVVDGINIIQKHLNINNAYIGIEDNKAEAIKLLDEATSDNENIHIIKLKSRYPQGAEKLIIYAATGEVVNEGQLPANAGVLVMNVSSVAFVSTYFKTGMPLIQKTVTVDGSTVKSPKNVNVLVGTPIKEVLEFCDCDLENSRKILFGGPMMGQPVYDVNAPIVKNNNAVLAFDEIDSKPPKTTACIKCGKCVKVCPVKLMPATLEKAHDSKNIQLLKDLKVNLCINCGCCSYICPAKRMLAQKNQISKSMINNK